MTDKNAEKRADVMMAEAKERAAWSNLVSTPQYKAYREAKKAMEGTPEFRTHAESHEAMEELWAEHGEPVHCEGCGVPLFEGDDYVWSDDGIYTCRGYENGPCYKPSDPPKT